MLEFIKTKGDCTGCTACMSSCPINCIQMIEDEEGFLYPEASNECIHCGLCEKICPINNPLHVNNQYKQKAFAAVSKSHKIWNRSASGGAFSEICRAWEKEDTLFVGAAWDGLYVHHTCEHGFDSIGKLCKSKYISSNLENVFREIKSHLGKDKRVLFCGTPCQVAGLKKYLKKDYDNILLVDLVCHGVGSPKVFRECIKKLEKQFDKKIIKYEFRTKKRTYDIDHIQKITTDQGKELYITKDQYMQLFLKQTCLRPSCGENCIFRNENRQGDLTIADFKGLFDVFENKLGQKKNYSTIVFNTSKSEQILPVLKENMEMMQCDIEDIKKHNPLFYKHTWFSKERNLFFEKFKVSPSDAIDEYTCKATEYTESFKHRVWNVFPCFVRKIILKRIINAKKDDGR